MFKYKSLLLLPIALASTFAVVNTTACSMDGIPTAPDKFYGSGNGTTPYYQYDNTYYNIMFPWNNDWTLGGTYNQPSDVFANTKLYTNNMVKWDIIAEYCRYVDAHFTAKFIEFDRKNDTIKYKIDMSILTPNGWVTHQINTIDANNNYGFTQIYNPEEKFKEYYPESTYAHELNMPYPYAINTNFDVDSDWELEFETQEYCNFEFGESYFLSTTVINWPVL